MLNKSCLMEKSGFYELTNMIQYYPIADWIQTGLYHIQCWRKYSDPLLIES